MADNRERHFHATTRPQKLACKRADKKLRRALATKLKHIGRPLDDAEKIARWDPYDQNASADWFDPEWMFGIGERFAEAEDIFASTYPAIHAHFESFREKLINRYDQGKYFWELRACAYWEEFQQPKIVYPDIAQGTAFAFDDSGYFWGNTSYLLPTKEMWLLGLLNSKAIFWFYTKTSTQIRGGFVRFIAQYVSQIPIPPIKPAQKASISKIVNQILATKRANPDADVSDLENEIDQIVYLLYDLTPEEIKIVEGTEKCLNHGLDRLHRLR